ncbi:NucA/NucB deoxyribonuclease domain-containing protein [Streptomyces cavernae]|uniref:NucA/NucB deoxyribonuclease domain-containing protein n=1 Tax=Streptomyces cavernae TaxID=2259034 RepID=UPI000FEC1378|nr:NucA/NucB deoxyribonuclease domain-containing protein [Streptomyces cavernae]
MPESETSERSSRRAGHRRKRPLMVLLGVPAVIGALLFGYVTLDDSNSADAAIVDPQNCIELHNVANTFNVQLLDESDRIDADLKLMRDEGPSVNATTAAFRLDDLLASALPEWEQQESILSTDQESLDCDDDISITTALEDIDSEIRTIQATLTNDANEELISDVITSEEDGYDPCLDEAAVHAAPAAGSGSGDGNNVVPLAGNVVKVDLSESKYPESTQHIKDAIAAGAPAVLTLDRRDPPGTANKDTKCNKRRKLSLKGHKRVKGKDRDEYPFAMTAEGGAGASVRAIDPSDNRGSGSTVGKALSGQPDGTQFQINFVP